VEVLWGVERQRATPCTVPQGQWPPERLDRGLEARLSSAERKQRQLNAADCPRGVVV
jgi:hypothetical protein